MLPVAPRIVNDVAYAMRINHEIHFAWQPLELEAAFCCSAHGSGSIMTYFVVQGGTDFVVQGSTGVVLCSTR